MMEKEGEYYRLMWEERQSNIINTSYARKSTATATKILPASWTSRALHFDKEDMPTCYAWVRMDHGEVYGGSSCLWMILLLVVVWMSLEKGCSNEEVRPACRTKKSYKSRKDYVKSHSRCLFLSLKLRQSWKSPRGYHSIIVREENIQRRRITSSHHANNFHTSPQMQTAPPSPNLRPTPSLNRPTTNRRQHQNVSNLSHLPISHLWLGTPYWIMVAWGPALNVMAILLTWKTASCGTLRDLVDNVLNVPYKTHYL